MVDWSKVSYQCGCGYRTRDADAAEMHVQKTGHTMTVQGVVLPDAKDAEQLRLKLLRKEVS